eukprot:gene6079-2680_t
MPVAGRMPCWGGGRAGTTVTMRASSSSSSGSGKEKKKAAGLSSWFKNTVNANSSGKQAEDEALALAKPQLSAEEVEDQRVTAKRTGDQAEDEALALAKLS